ncbi:hypothetical protein JTE90_010627 [Oedothorax gibbosus]|uniref:Uncharacterized protein n=1 Tax=Oedothorax gibbosus TaxID=931172 RepID=A0AAV6VGH5_9ARAC|nr:hypothetical protein JTE90_010627 [Oedothorax gibbosus]
MPDLRSVDLSKNHLSAVSETVFGSVNNHLGDLSLSGNPLICNCNISWIVPLQGHRYLDGYCTEPESLKERSLVTLRNGDFKFCKENVTET